MESRPPIEQAALELLARWFDQERKNQEGGSDRYIVCAGLAVLEILKRKFPIRAKDYLTRGNQVKTSGPLIKKILREHGETRRYSAEGGRTTRSTRPAAERLVRVLNEHLSALQSLPSPDREAIAHDLQGWLVRNFVTAYFERQQLEIEVSLSKPAPQIIGDIIAAASKRNQAGCVAQHLVGAKLALRFPNAAVENRACTSADVQAGRPGDFTIGDTVFHVTVAPMPAVIEKCADNVKNGYRAILLVSESKLQAARQLAELRELQDRIGILPLEQFVGQNIEELSSFGKSQLADNLKALIAAYNERVAAVETDRSLLIKIPENL
jgi:hypothetical protein